MGKKKELLFIAIGLVFVFVYGGFKTGFIDFGGSAQSNPNAPMVKFIKQQITFAIHESAYENAMSTMCGPNYEISCLLEDTLQKLQRHGFDDEAGFAALMTLTDTINHYHEPRIQAELLAILNAQTTRLWSKDERLRLALMKTYFATGQIEEGEKILTSFKDNVKPYAFAAFPAAQAVNALVFTGRLDDAVGLINKIRYWKMLVEPAPVGCLGDTGGKSNSIDFLIPLLMKSKNFTPLAALLSVAADPASIFHDQYSYEHAVGHISDFLYNHTPYQKPPYDAALCNVISENSRANRTTEMGAFVLMQIGCTAQARELAEMTPQPPLPSNDTLIILGKTSEAWSNALLKHSGPELVQVATRYHQFGMTKERDEAIEKIATDYSVRYQSNDPNIDSYTVAYYALLRRIGDQKAIDLFRSRFAGSPVITREEDHIAAYPDNSGENGSGPRVQGAWVEQMRSCVLNNINLLPSNEPNYLAAGCASSMIDIDVQSTFFRRMYQ